MIEGVDNRGIDATVDLGWARDTRRAKPCARRIGNAWCTEPDKHEGPCIAPVCEDVPPSDFGPRRAPPRWGR